MSSTKYIVFFLKTSYLPIAVIDPGNDNNIKSEIFSNEKCYKLLIDKSEFNIFDNNKKNSILKEVVKKLPPATGSSHGFYWPAWDGLCAILDKNNNVVSYIKMDPDYHIFPKDHQFFNYDCYPTSEILDKASKVENGKITHRFIVINRNSYIEDVIYGQIAPNIENKKSIKHPTLNKGEIYNNQILKLYIPDKD